jgi:hypothetical protein
MHDVWNDNTRNRSFSTGWLYRRVLIDFSDFSVTSCPKHAQPPARDSVGWRPR